MLISGNVESNPGPVSVHKTPDYFKSGNRLGFMHLNVHSQVAKMDMIHIWTHSTDGNYPVIETWLRKSIQNKEISFGGYTVFRANKPKKGGGIAIYIKNQISNQNDFFLN